MAHRQRFLGPGDKLGTYDLIRQIAVGTMAELYLARTTGIEGFEQLLVVKRVLPQFRDNERFVTTFLDEARLAATLQHPNIVQVYEAGQDAGECFFAMEYVHGEDLGRLVEAAADQGVGLPLDAALTLVAATCAGLNYAHAKAGPDGRPLHIVHRDVSPSNVLVSYDGAVKLVDFGIARAETSPAARGGLGKVAYRSPEQCAGGAVDRRSDLYVVGTILYELTTGRLPFEGDNEYAIVQQIVNRDVPPPTSLIPNYPRALETIVMRALAREPERRFRSAIEMQGQLEDFAHENRLKVSPVVVSRLMSSLFPHRLEEWEHARAQGAFFVEQHVLRMLVESGKTPPIVEGAQAVTHPAAAAADAAAARATPTPHAGMPHAAALHAATPPGAVAVVGARTPAGALPVVGVGGAARTPPGALPVVGARTPPGAVPIVSTPPGAIPVVGRTTPGPIPAIAGTPPGAVPIVALPNIAPIAVTPPHAVPVISSTPPNGVGVRAATPPNAVPAVPEGYAVGELTQRVRALDDVGGETSLVTLDRPSRKPFIVLALAGVVGAAVAVVIVMSDAKSPPKQPMANTASERDESKPQSALSAEPTLEPTIPTDESSTASRKPTTPVREPTIDPTKPPPPDETKPSPATASARKTDDKTDNNTDNNTKTDNKTDNKTDKTDETSDSSSSGDRSSVTPAKPAAPKSLVKKRPKKPPPKPKPSKPKPEPTDKEPGWNDDSPFLPVRPDAK